VASPVAPPPRLYCYPLLRRGASTDTVLRVRAVLGIIVAGGICGADRAAAHRAGLAPAPFPPSAAVRVFIAEEEIAAQARVVRFVVLCFCCSRSCLAGWRRRGRRI